MILSFLLRTLNTFRKAHLSRSYIDPATLYALMNINKPKLRGVMYTLFFFNKTSCSYSMFGTSTKVTFHCIKRKHIVFKLTLTADKCRFPQRGLLLRRRVSSRRGDRWVSVEGCEEEMQLQPAPSFHEIKYSELFSFKGCSGTK